MSQVIQEDEIDLRELFFTLKKGKNIIWSVTGVFVLLALVYIFTVTPWWEANATIEIGKKIQDKSEKSIYIEDGKGVSARFQVKYIDTMNNIKNRDGFIKSISSSKKNPQFISITALGKDTQLAVNEVKKVIDNLLLQHGKIIEEVSAKKKAELSEIDRDIYQLKNGEMQDILDSIDYIKKIQIPSIAKTIASVNDNLKKSKFQKDDALKNLILIKDEPSLSALRMAQIQNLEYKISNNEIKLIELHRKKQKLIKITLATKERKLSKVQKVEIVLLEDKRKLAILSMNSYNYYNSAIVGNIVTQDHPIKPKKKLIVIVAFITGLMLSIFLVFLLEFISTFKEEDK